MISQVSRLLKSIFFVGMSAYLPLLAAQPSKAIDFKSAVHLALNQNPRIGQAQARIDAAQAAIMETRGAGLPQLNMEINAAHSNNPLDVFGFKLSQGNVSFADFGLGQYTGPNSLYTKPSALNSPGYYNNINPGFKLAIPIYSGGKNLAQLRSTQALLDAACHGSKAAKNQLAFEILQAYEGVKAAAKLKAIAKDSVRQARNYVNLTQDLRRQSKVLDSDILLAESYLRNTQINLQAAEDELNNHLDAFHLLIGQHNSHYIPGPSVRLSLPALPIAQLTQQALNENAQLHSMKSNIIASRANIDAANAAHLPQLNLQLRHDWNGKDVGQGKSSDAVLLRLDWLLFSSGMQTAAVNKAFAEYKEANYHFDDLANTIRLALNKEKRAEHLAAEQTKAYRLNAQKARAVVKQIHSRYGRGLVPLGELLNNKMRWDEAKSQQVISRYQQVLAQGRLLMITNQLLVDEA